MVKATQSCPITLLKMIENIIFVKRNQPNWTSCSLSEGRCIEQEWVDIKLFLTELCSCYNLEIRLKINHCEFEMYFMYHLCSGHLLHSRKKNFFVGVLESTCLSVRLCT